VRIEAFSLGKDPRARHANEDRFVLLPGRAYAVIDGATDRLGTRYDGLLSGQYAAVTVQAALERLLASAGAAIDDEAFIVEGATRAIADAYRRHGTLDLARRDPNHRFSATLAYVATVDDTVKVVLVGDSGVRLNGRHVLQVEKDLDVITSILRQQAWEPISAATADPVERERLSRLIAFNGSRLDPARVRPWLDEAALSRIEAAALAANRARLPHVPEADVARLVQGGIVNAQGGYQNDASSILGYSCLDGFDVPMRLVRVETFTRSEIETIEVFSDGYFRPGDGFGVASWETAFEAVEREDREKIRLHLSPKGSTDEALADDRTYVGVDLRDPAQAG
jgi:hypothetical protein